MAKYTTVYRQYRLVYEDKKIFKWIRILLLERKIKRTNKKLLNMGVMEILVDNEYLTLEQYETKNKTI